MRRLRALAAVAFVAVSLALAACGGPPPSHASGGKPTHSATSTSTTKSTGWG